MKVSVLNHTPNADRTVVACARGDYMEGSLVGVDLADEESYSEIVESVDGADTEEKTRNFVQRLLRRGHFGPFEHPSITFAVEGVSRSCMAQMTRHRHATFDVQSQRYVDFEDAEGYVPDSFKDGEFPKEMERPDEWLEMMYERQFGKYQMLVGNGVPKEDARMILPIGTKVNLTATFNLRSLMHVLDLRENMKAQAEARELASEMRESAKEVAPHTIEMYEEHINNNSLRAP